MSFRTEAVRNTSDFVQLLREFLSAHAALTDLFSEYPADSIPFEAVRVLVGDDERAVLYRLKQRSHALFRSETYRSQAVRREALFDLIVGSLFHETMKLRESLYQREVYAPRVAALRDSASEEPDALFEEFDRILGKSSARLNEVVSEVRILLSQTREQFRRLLIERAGDADVTRFLLARRSEVDATFPDGFEALLVAMHGDFSTGLIEAARSLLGSAYFLEAEKTLREAARKAGETKSEILQLQLYAEGMQAFLDGDYRASIASIEGWVDLGASLQEPELARRAALALSRIGRLVENDGAGSALADTAKQLQLRLEMPSR